MMATFSLCGIVAYDFDDDDAAAAEIVLFARWLATVVRRAAGRERVAAGDIGKEEEEVKKSGREGLVLVAAVARSRARLGYDRFWVCIIPGPFLSGLLGRNVTKVALPFVFAV